MQLYRLCVSNHASMGLVVQCRTPWPHLTPATSLNIASNQGYSITTYTVKYPYNEIQRRKGRFFTIGRLIVYDVDHAAPTLKKSVKDTNSDNLSASWMWIYSQKIHQVEYR